MAVRRVVWMEWLVLRKESSTVDKMADKKAFQMDFEKAFQKVVESVVLKVE